MTSPVEFPMYGKFKKTELSKENLLAFWDMVLNRADFKVSHWTKGRRHSERMRDGDFHRSHGHQCEYRLAAVISRSVAPATSQAGRKGEELSKVMYRLIEADHYINKKILVVGGGDSAVEAAMGLANQKGNQSNAVLPAIRNSAALKSAMPLELRTA